MAAGATYEPIATSTLGSNGNFSFTSIASGYGNLVLHITGKSTSNGQMIVRLNNDASGTAYIGTQLYSSSSSVASSNYDFLPGFYSGSFHTSYEGFQRFYFPNYDNSYMYKTMIGFGGEKTQVVAGVFTYKSTSPISRIDVYGNGFDLATGATATLYKVVPA